MKLRVAAAAAILILALTSRLSHKDVVWIEEAYPAAAAIQMSEYGLHLYQDFWFDKPPGAVYFYRLIGAPTGVPLRLAGAAFVCLSALLAFLAARKLWDQDDSAAIWAALFTAVFLTFDHPATVMAIAPDLLMVPVHLLALYLVAARQPAWAGIACGLGFWINPKAVFMTLALVVWSRSWVLATVAAASALALLAPYWEGFYEQVIVWGRMYSADPPEGVAIWKQTAAWLWFHAALVLGAILSGERRWILQIAINTIGVALGMRFFPRYFFQLLPLFVLLAARGTSLAKPRLRFLIAALLLIPAIRFGRLEPPANQLALYHDSVQAAAKLADRKATLFVWGYRPDILLLTRMKLGAEYLDSQPINGVLADRHLVSSKQSTAGRTTVFEADYVADGLGLLNPKLAFRQSGYEEFARTKFTILYRRVK